MSMKRRIAAALGRGHDERLWTWWRVLGLALMVATLSIIAFAGCRAQPGTVPDAQVSPPSDTQAGEQPASPDAEAEKLAERYAKAVAVIQTNKGEIRLAFFAEDAPRTVHNFAKLANTKFYDGLKWHRYEPGFVIQGGDPDTKNLSAEQVVARQLELGRGGPGYTIPPEFNENRHSLGAVAMARAADPASAGSQFYITLGDAPWLDGQYTVFGRVTKGIDVVKKLRVGDLITRVRVTGVAE